MASGKYLGIRRPFIDAKEKVTGKAEYLDDLQFPNLLYGKILRSPHAHARIVNIDTREAEALPGVKAVITHKDTPQTKFGMEVPDVSILADGKVRYVGDEVAAVAAETEEQAQKAIELINVEYELLPVLDDPEDSLKPGAPVIHEEKPDNIAKEYHINRGDVEKDFAECDYVFEKEFSTHRVVGLYLEPLGAVAKWETDGRLTMWTALQAMFQGRTELARALGIEPSRIRMISPYMGGGFGARIWLRNLHPIVAVLAQKAGRPVKIIMTREEEMLTTRPRVAPRMKMKIGMMKDGTLVTKQTDILADNGAYTWGATKIVMNMSMRTDCLYRFKSSKTDAKLVYTNLIPTSGFRGYGNSQMHFALESLLDMACNKIGLDPAEVRLKNCVKKGDVTLHGWNVRSCALDESIARAAESIKKGHQPSNDPEGRYKRGIGIACMTHVSGNRGGSKFDGSSALIRIHEDGNVFIYKGEADMGQGARTVFSQIAAETLGIPMEKINVMPIDTDVSPYCLGSYSSRVSTVGGNAVKIAAEKVLDQLLGVAAVMSGAPKESLQMEDGVISSTSDPKVSLTLEEVAFHAIRTQNGTPLTEYITYEPPTTGADSNYYGDYSSAYTYGAHGVEVEVDTHTGKVKVLRVVAAHDLGKVINEMGAKGQVTGGVAQGIGWALYEDMVFDEGKPVCRDLHGYTLMTIADMPPVEIHLLETDDPIGPYGAKGIGEPTLIPTAPAIANAIENAVGVRITSLPMTPEKLYRAIREKEAKAKS